jgi:hypothetical protein
LERVQHLATEKLGELEGSGKAKNDDEDWYMVEIIDKVVIGASCSLVIVGKIAMTFILNPQITLQHTSQIF